MHMQLLPSTLLQNLNPSQTSSNDVNHQDDRHEVECPTDSSVVVVTHSLSDSARYCPDRTIPNQSVIETTIMLSKNMILGKNHSVTSPSLGDMVVNEQVDHVSRPSSTTRVTSSSSRDTSQSYLREKRLEECHQQQMKVIQSIYKRTT